MAIAPYNTALNNTASKKASDTEGGACHCVDFLGNGRSRYGTPTQRRRRAPLDATVRCRQHRRRPALS